MRQIKINLTKQEYDNLYLAVQIFKDVSKNKQFFNVVRSTLEAPNLVDSQIYKEVCDPLITVVNKVQTSRKNNTDVTKNFFVQELPITDASQQLFLMVQHKITSPLRYDQMKSTCISDVKTMLHRYGIIDDFIRGISPSVAINETSINSKNSIQCAKEIADWKPTKKEV